MDEYICSECGSHEYYFSKVVRKYTGDGYDFSLIVDVPFCKNCDSLITVESIESSIDKRAQEIIRLSRDIISREEICSILEKWEISKEALSHLLGWDETILSNYIDYNCTPNQKNNAILKRVLNAGKNDMFSLTHQAFHKKHITEEEYHWWINKLS